MITHHVLYYAFACEISIVMCYFWECRTIVQVIGLFDIFTPDETADDFEV